MTGPEDKSAAPKSIKDVEEEIAAVKARAKVLEKQIDEGGQAPAQARSSRGRRYVLAERPYIAPGLTRNTPPDAPALEDRDGGEEHAVTYLTWKAWGIIPLT